MKSSSLRACAIRPSSGLGITVRKSCPNTSPGSAFRKVLWVSGTGRRIGCRLDGREADLVSYAASDAFSAARPCICGSGVPKPQQISRLPPKRKAWNLASRELLNRGRLWRCAPCLLTYRSERQPQLIPLHLAQRPRPSTQRRASTPSSPISGTPSLSRGLAAHPGESASEISERSTSKVTRIVV